MDLDYYSSIWMAIVFIAGYSLITLEHLTKINKTTVALMMAIVCWVILFVRHPCEENQECFLSDLADISQIVFFLLGALTIVEIVSIHNGFDIISDFIKMKSKKQLLWVMGFTTFFLSSVLDNLTTTIVMVALLGKLLHKDQDRLIIGGGLVIAANAGGAWTPIGDVTTTMLWIGGQLSTQHMIPSLFLPSLGCLLVSFFVLSFFLKGNIGTKPTSEAGSVQNHSLEKIIFFIGISALIFVPVFKLLTGLPPLMGILFGLSTMWIITDWLHGGIPEREHLKVPTALTKIDFPSALFFLGILLSVAALSRAGILGSIAIWLDNSVGNISLIATTIGLVSAIIDNIPLVAATMGMYPLSQYPADSKLWDLIAYCAGTGGSILLIGSPAGVVYMGIEKVKFFWYLKWISFPALVGYLAGIAIYLIT